MNDGPSLLLKHKDMNQALNTTEILLGSPIMGLPSNSLV